MEKSGVKFLLQHEKTYIFLQIVGEWKEKKTNFGKEQKHIHHKPTLFPSVPCSLSQKKRTPHKNINLSLTIFFQKFIRPISSRKNSDNRKLSNVFL